jgi:N utilization substance protein B
MTEPVSDAPNRPAVKPASGRKRSMARLAAVQALYQIALTDADAIAVTDEFVTHRLDREIDGDRYGEADRTLFADLVKGVSERGADIDGMIAAALPGEWPLERLETLLRAILRAGAYELLARPDVPARTAITEYIEIAHAFYSGKEPGMVNGVLDRLARTLRRDDMKAAAGDGGG